ncbi:MAG: peptidoglycan endopeptidase [Novosphingobium sp.]|uniref:peptidoglycan endopeptidase n=1 Tax=Novosphingobium sp. TaxID=1874826 RepID=UPI00273540D4|nr:peptidoglycan endopeptidase [Novosphingobium sp.]MDP3551843.1 peptidoglycan endopeptidase [Novosphingobium sp.]
MTRALGQAALGLVGVPFRLHGRNATSGLDCVGVVAEALRRTGVKPTVPEGYSLRGTAVSGFVGCAALSGLDLVDADGDVVLCMVNPVQMHLAVRAGDGFVHANASLRRVTFMPGPLPWPAKMQWRLSNGDWQNLDRDRTWQL